MVKTVDNIMNQEWYTELMSRELRYCDLCTKSEVDFVGGELRKIETMKIGEVDYWVCEACEPAEKIHQKMYEDGRSDGFQFACRHYCEHCKAGGEAKRISDEQIDFIIKDGQNRPADWALAPLEDQLWRHAPRKGENPKFTPLCMASSLQEAWRRKDA